MTESTKRNKWIIPPGLKKSLDEFKATCDVFFNEPSDQQKSFPIMICGPTGVGKSVFTDYFVERYYQIYPNRRSREPIIINCAAIPKDLMESTLFGHVKGAFTGAVQKKSGFFNESEDIIILEEIGELPKTLQAKLLVVIEKRIFYKIGDPDKKMTFNGQIIATTNKTQESFREDFFYRFFPFYIPPLHKRRQDILYYFHLFDDEVLSKLTEANILSLLSYNWPGNVREIKRFCRLFKINYKLNNYPINMNLSYLGLEIPGVSDINMSPAFIDPKKYFTIHPNYSNFDIKKPSMFFSKLFEDNNDGIDKFEKMIDHFVGFKDMNTPLLEMDEEFEMDEEEDEKIVKNIKLVNNSKINIVFAGYSVFCILFFRDLYANYDLLEYDNFHIPKLTFNFRYKKIFDNWNSNELEEISLKILSLFSKILEFQDKRKKLPTDYQKRRQVIEKIYNRNKNNSFLAQLLEISDNTTSKKKVEIEDLSQDEILSYYYETLVAEGKSGVEIAKISGKTPPMVSANIKKYNIIKKTAQKRLFLSDE